MLRSALGGLAVAAAVEGEMAGDGEEKRLGRGDFATLPRPQEAQVRLLHEIIEIVLGPEPAAQPRAQHRLVRLHVSRKPLAKFGIGLRHRGKLPT